MKKILFSLVILFQINSSYSQNSYWTKSQTKINFENTVDQPLHFKQFTLNTTIFLENLKNVSKANSNFFSNSIIELPNEKGELIKFNIYEKSNFAPELAEKYPNIKSYIGKSIKDNSIANISYSPSQGLNVAILNSAKSTTLIKPTFVGGTTYIVFSRSEISIENPFECEDLIAARTNNSALDLRNINDGFLRKYRLTISTTAEFSQFWLDGSETTDIERKGKVIAALNTTLTRINGIFERDFSIVMELIGNNDQVVYLDASSDPYSGVSNSILQNTLDNVIGDSNYDVGHLFHYEDVIHGNAGCIACVCTPGSKGSGWTGHSAPDSDNFNLIASHEFGHQFGGWHVQSSSNCRSSNEMQEVEPGSGSTIMGYAGICPANVQSGPDDYFNYVDIRDVIQWTRNDSSCAQLIGSGNTAPTANAGSDYTIPKSTPFILEGTGSDSDGDAITFCWEENDPENPFSSDAPTSTRSQGPMFRSLLPVAVPYRYMPNITDTAAGISPTWEVLPSISRTMDFVLTVRDNHAVGAQTASDEMTVTVDANAGPFVVTSQTTTETWNVGDNINISWDVANTDQSPINTTVVDILLSIDGGLTYPYTIASNIVNNGNTSLFLPNVPTSSQGRIMVKANNNIFYAINSADINIQASEFLMDFVNVHEQNCKPNNIVFDFTYNTFLSFDETTTFSATNLPAGATITFNPSTATTDGTNVQAIISNTNAIALGEHNFIIKGVAASVEKNVNVSINVYDSNITAPILTNPINGETSIDPFGTLNWDSDLNADTYTIEIANDATFSTMIETATVATNLYQANNLDYDTTYFWRVKSNNDCGSSTFSSVFNFTTFCIAPSNINISNVILDGATVSWNENGNATFWEIEVVEVGNSPTGIGVPTPTNPFTISGLNSSTDYVVYVRSSCGSGNFSDWTMSSIFTTAADFCSGDHFYDTGGVSDPYSNGENIKTTIAPSIGNNTIIVTFNSFNIENGYDYLQVYDGSDTNAPLLGTYSGSSIPGPFTSNNPNGTLTFWFTSDSIINDSGWDATVDCLNISCPTPYSFISQNINNNSLDLSWIAGDTETEWEIEYGITGFAQGSGTVLQTTTNPQSIIGLNSNTVYDFYIRANCGANPGDDDSLWLGPISFTTLCDTFSTPFVEDVESFNGNYEIENCWSATPLASSGNYAWNISSNGYTPSSGTGPSQANSGTTYFYTEASGYYTGDIAELITPLIDISDLTIPQLTFYYHMYGYAMGSLHIDILNNGSWTNDLLIIDGQQHTSGSSPWTEQALVLSNFTGEIQIRFRGIRGVSYESDMSIDDIQVVEAPTCPKPTNLTESNVNINSVDLSWVAGNSETSWQLEYGTTGFTQGTGTLLQLTTNSHTITGLIPNTTYDFYVRANCGTNPGDDDSLWVGPLTSTTLISCPQPNNLYVNTTYNSAEINWTSGGSETKWEIEYGNYGFTQGTGTLIQTNSNSYTITGLENSNSYQVYVRANCGANPGDDDSNWVGPYYFSTQNLPSPSNLTTNLDQDTGSVTLNWNAANYNGSSDFETYYIYRDGALVATSVSETYTDNLPIYGNYYYYVRAKYNQGESYQTNTEYVLWESCPEPTNLIVSNETKISVDLAWDLGYSETVWEIEYGNYGFNQGSGTYIQATTNPFTLTGLNHSTKYNVYLRANCGTNPGDDDSNWIGPITFSTLCDTFNSPYLDDVEAHNGTYTPTIENCWEAVPNNTTSSYYWNVSNNGYTPSSYTGPSQANSGSHFFYTEAGYYNTGDVAELITPIINVSSLTLPQLTFFYHMYGSDMGSLNIDVYSNGNWTNDLLTISGQHHTSGTTPWTEQTLILDGYTGDIQIRFRSIRGSGTRSDMAIDDIQVTEAPTCPKPTNFTANNISITSTYLNWIAGNTENNWEIEYGIEGFTHGQGVTIQTTNNTISLSGLDSATNYDVYLRANCGANPGDDDSLWVGPLQFTTLVDYCNGDHFYDTGGVSGNYSNSENTITTITPSAGYNNVSVVFNSFSLETCCDYLNVYDGPDVNSPLLGSFGSNPGSFMSTHASGALTFLFHSDGSVTSSGWDATVTCLNISCPQPTNLVENNITASTVDLSWTNGNTETNWEIEYGDIGFAQGTGTTVAVTTNPFTLTGLIAETTYDVYLRAVCGANPGDDDSFWTEPITFTTQALAKPYNLTANLDETNGEVTLNWNQTSSFYEDFTDGIANDWFSVFGDWSVANNTFNATSNTQTNLSNYYNQDFTNFELEIRARKTQGEQYSLHFYFNGDPSSTDSNNYWQTGYLFLISTDGQFSLYKLDNGNYTALRNWSESIDLNIGLGAWNTLKVAVSNGYIDVYINGISQGSYFDDTFLSGKIGLGMFDSNYSGIAEFDYVSINELPTNYNFGTVTQNETREVYNTIPCNNCNITPIRTEMAPVPSQGLNYSYKNLTTSIFQNYKIYRDGTEIDTSIPETYLDQLPSYGDYQYYVTSIYDEGESLPSNTVNVSWHGTPNIIVNPLVLSQTLYTNENATQPVIITNNGDDDLNFTINSSVVSTNYQNIGFGNIETENLTPYTIENSVEEIIKTPTFSKRTYFNTTDTPNILIYEETVNYNYYTDALISLGYTFTQVSGWYNLETAINDGTNWQLIIANSYNSGATTSALTALDSYQSNGGSLIFADWRVSNNTSHPIFSNMGISYINDITTPINFSATDTSHSIFNSPNQISAFTWSNDQYPVDGQIVNVINGATQLAAFDGYSTNGAIVLNANQNCIFNAFQSANFQNDDNANGKDDIQELLENEINYLIGNSWLSTTQTSGTVTAGSSVTIDVNFDSTDMTVGTYNGTVEISSNDPDEPIVYVAAELIVIDDTDSINELSQFDFKYYPNPFSNNINISANANFDSVKVYSLLGQELMKINPDNQSQLTIDVSKLSVGTYFMKVVIDGKISTLKIIKK